MSVPVLVRECIKCLLSEYYKVIFMNRQLYFAVKIHGMRRHLSLAITVLEEGEEILLGFKEDE